MSYSIFGPFNKLKSVILIICGDNKAYEISGW